MRWQQVQCQDYIASKVLTTCNSQADINNLQPAQLSNSIAACFLRHPIFEGSRLETNVLHPLDTIRKTSQFIKFFTWVPHPKTQKPNNSICHFCTWNQPLLLERNCWDWIKIHVLASCVQLPALSLFRMISVCHKHEVPRDQLTPHCYQGLQPCLSIQEA